MKNFCRLTVAIAACVCLGLIGVTESSFRDAQVEAVVGSLPPYDCCKPSHRPGCDQSNFPTSTPCPISCDPEVTQPCTAANCISTFVEGSICLLTTKTVGQNTCLFTQVTDQTKTQYLDSFFCTYSNGVTDTYPPGDYFNSTCVASMGKRWDEDGPTVSIRVCDYDGDICIVNYAICE